MPDTSDILRKTSKIEIPDNSYLVSLDIRSLDTRIHNSEGMKTAITSLEDFPRRTVAARMITTFLSLILTLNNFVFNCRNYSKIKNCAMATICKPTYDNIFMDHFERKQIYPFLERLSLNQLRFIVDMFLIWTGSKDQLIKFFNDLNSKKQQTDKT